MGITSWVKKKMAILSLAMAGVEKNALGQNNNGLEKGINQERRHSEGTLMDSLKEGKITQEVMDLRWRMYKVLKAAEDVSTEITSYDEDNMPITSSRKTHKGIGLYKIKVDPFDHHTLLMVVDNTPITTSVADAMYGNINTHTPTTNNNENGEQSVTHGTISGEEYFASSKTEIPLHVTRDAICNFDIETYTKRLLVRKINETKRLLEFYVSKYPDEYNRTSRLFISEVKKAIGNPRQTTILDIKKVNYVSYKTMGVDDFLEYEYNITGFDKIVDFNGHYVIKFNAEVVIDGVDIMEKHKMDELDAKYENKERRKK